MGWNSWNFWNCRVNASILMDTATAISTSGLAASGYTYVSSDDCWMNLARDENGRQVANPDKFPDGWLPVTTHIHSLGLLAGLYTAKGPTTCAGFAASCDHELIDAANWASLGIDLVKDDSCSTCPNRTDNDDYAVMWGAIQAAGRPMVLMVEGSPTDSLITQGGFGNSKRVGHDISPEWMSMVSLVDIGSGLWPFAHNSTNATYGGWFNDLDMIEIGNAPDFACGADEASLARCQAHFTMWCTMKAPLIMGNDVPSIDAATLSVLTNAEAIAVNQDAWGIQARRVAVLPPSNATIGACAFDNIAVAGGCDSRRPTQTWMWTNKTSPIRNLLYALPCNAADPYQQWTFTSAGQLENAGSGLCVDSKAQVDPGMVVPCSTSAPSQQWAYSSTSGHVANAAGNCLDVFDFSGPDVEIGSCKVPGAQDSNQVWAYAGGTLKSASTGLPSNSCLAVSGGTNGGTFSTKDGAGNVWCLVNRFGAEGGWGGAACPSGDCRNIGCTEFTPSGPSPPVSGPANYTLDNSRGAPGWNNQEGASGPWPSTRYISGFTWSNGAPWTLDLAAAQTPTGTTVQAADHTGLYNDDLVGHVTQGGDFCLDLVTGGMLEVWAGALSGGRIAVTLFNRSPAADIIMARWMDIGAAGSYAVRDIWAGVDRGVFTDSYATIVPAHATTFLVLTPAS